MYFGSQKREPCKNFYMVPNEIMRLGLSVGEIAVYNYLMYCEDHKTYQCYPSYRKMGEALGLTRKTVMKYVRSLEEKCLITTEHTTVTLKSGKKQNGNLLYTIRPIQAAVDYFIGGNRSSQQGSQQNGFCWEEVMTPQSTSFSCPCDTETSA